MKTFSQFLNEALKEDYPNDGAYEDFEYETQEEAAEQFAEHLENCWDYVDSVYNDLQNYCPDLYKDCKKEADNAIDYYFKFRDKLEQCAKKKYGKADI